MANAADLERGKFFEHKGELLQVLRKGVISVGTHSHTKLSFTVCDLSGKREKEMILAHNDKVDMVDIMKKKASVIAKSGNSIQIMDAQTYETYDALCEPDILETLNEGDEIIFIEYKGVHVLGKKKQG
jgi:translation initiation factor 5A